MQRLTTRDLEQYEFHRLYSIDLHEAYLTLSLLSRYRRADIRYVIIRDAVISYTRPFSGNRGNAFPSHVLSTSVVHRAMRPLHKELMHLRNRSFAHSDREIRNPKVARWPTKSGGGLYPMSFTPQPMQDLDRKWREIRALVESVQEGINTWTSEWTRQYDLQADFDPQGA